MSKLGRAASGKSPQCSGVRRARWTNWLVEVVPIAAVSRQKVFWAAGLAAFPAQAVYLPGSWDFRIRSTESIVFQLRVVAGAPKSLSIRPRQPMVFMWRRYTP
jgi:hypothetical protein